VATANAEVVAELRGAYEQWWTSLSPVFDEEVRIVLGNAAQSPTTLTCHDWHSEDVPWDQNAVSRDPVANGYWSVEIERAGRYAITLRTRPEQVSHPISAERARLRVGEDEVESEAQPDSASITLSIDLPAGPARLQTWLMSPEGTERGAYFVTVERLRE
jgi:hypothetical protein